ncbi:sensor histidine kinase [Persicitalea jodogahamensis]|uniref:histidine kinase n=1 Tax=Persicitalea jodogahamensis TaxID=402147 RepID=A0A8J3GBT8_9BACT|nr:ATP-binding protein [Persicitalea jodogahamensis]GHB80044.1 sensor histidine kinase [Persicitalea jodogahamensis]
MKFSTRTTYIAYISVLHVVLIFLVYRLLFEDKLLFIASEVFLLISIGVSIQLYQNFLRPNEFIKSGIEAIKEKDFTIKFVPTGKGEIDVLIEVYNLMIDQLREERTKQQAQHFFLEKLIAASPTAIIILDFDDCIASVNSRAVSVFKLDIKKINGQKLNDTGIPFLRKLHEIKNGESKIVKADGVQKFKVQRSHFMDQGFRRSFLLIEELTSELLEQEKNAYGKVIRMMAHEVNNTLGATDSILQTTRKSLAASADRATADRASADRIKSNFPEDFSDLRDALKVASDRNRRLTRFMRNFADVVRLPPPGVDEFDLNRLVENVVVFLQSTARQSGISLKIIKNEPLVVKADSGQLEQVLINVIQNALEACEAGNEVQVLIDDNLIIRNNGKPILPQEAQQLFNPFYSSKPDGQGIGLTLSREILLNHGFQFSLKTNEDGWTEFVIDCNL